MDVQLRYPVGRNPTRQIIRLTLTLKGCEENEKEGAGQRTGPNLLPQQPRHYQQLQRPRPDVVKEKD